MRNFDKTYTTENGLFYIDCSAIHEALVPKLTAMSHELCDFVAEEAASIAKKVCDSVSTAFDVSFCCVITVSNKIHSVYSPVINPFIMQVLKKRETTVGGFAAFARHVALYKKNVPQHQQNVDYVRSLFEVSATQSGELSCL